jgi:L-ascorbate metabolism protein UlaG (beta-lactamase superfamily)
MEITWFGHSCFRLRGKDAALVTDPVSPETGYSPLARVNADIVTISHDHPGHSYMRGISGEPYVVARPGEYEIRNTLITGVPSYHDNQRGKARGRNTIYLIHIDDMVVCHLGDLGHPLTEDQQEAITDADILFVPVGGNSTITAAQAAEVISQIEPRLIIPMHYATAATQGKIPGLDPVEKFCEEMAMTDWQAQPKVTVTRSNLPAEPQVIIMSYRGQGG